MSESLKVVIVIPQWDQKVGSGDWVGTLGDLVSGKSANDWISLFVIAGMVLTSIGSAVSKRLDAFSYPASQSGGPSMTAFRAEADFDKANIGAPEAKLVLLHCAKENYA
jgi:hypothetical protein